MRNESKTSGLQPITAELWSRSQAKSDDSLAIVGYRHLGRFPTFKEYRSDFPEVWTTTTHREPLQILVTRQGVVT